MRDEDKEMADLLHQDTMSIREGEAFAPKLHQDRIRRIRHLDDSNAAGSWWRLKVTATLAAIATACILIFLPQKPTPPTSPDPEISRRPDPAPGSALAYRKALADGEGAMLAMLDRDARLLLPRSAPAFQALR